MNKKFWLYVFASIVFMAALPLYTVKIAAGGAGLIGFIFLLLIVNPLYMIFLGFNCGKNIKQLWSIPLISSALFWIGAALFMEMSVDGCIIYFAIYILAAYISMVTSYYIFHKKSDSDTTVKVKAVKIIAFIVIIAAFMAFILIGITKID